MGATMANTAPLTRSQSYYWLQYAQLDDHERAQSNIVLRMWLAPRTTVGEARAAVKALLGRHRGLRSSIFVDEAGQLRQRWHDVVELDFAVRDLDPFTPEQVEVAMDEAKSVPSDLSVARPLRAVALRNGEFVEILLLVVPHVFADASTPQLLQSEIRTIISNLRDGRPPTAGLPEPAHSTDVAEREGRPASQHRPAKALARFRKLFAEMPNTSFPYRARHKDDDPDFFAVRLMGENFGRSVTAACERFGVSEELFLLTAAALLVGRYTGLRQSGWQLPLRKVGRTVSFVGPNVQKGFLTVTEPETGDLSDLLTTVKSALIVAHTNADYDEFALLDERILAESARRTSIFFDCFYDCVWRAPGDACAAGSPDRRPVTIECLPDGHLRFLNYWPLALKIRGGTNVDIRLTAHRRAMTPTDAVDLLRGLESLVASSASGEDVSPAPLAKLADGYGWPRGSDWTYLPPRNIWVDLDGTRRLIEAHPRVLRAEVLGADDGSVRCLAEVRDPGLSGEQLAEHVFAQLRQGGIVVPDRFTLRVVATEPGSTHGGADVRADSAALAALMVSVATANDIAPPDPRCSYVAAGGRVHRVPAVNQILNREGWQELPVKLFLGHSSLGILSSVMRRQKAPL